LRRVDGSRTGGLGRRLASPLPAVLNSQNAPRVPTIVSGRGSSGADQDVFGDRASLNKRAGTMTMLDISVAVQSPALPVEGRSRSRRTRAPTRIQSARPFTSMPLAIDARERRVVGVIVAKGIGDDEPLPMGSDYHALPTLPGWDRYIAGRRVLLDDAVMWRQRTRSDATARAKRHMPAFGSCKQYPMCATATLQRKSAGSASEA
jgi:hypothetical protein